jgi:hypothetical protein
MTILSGYDYGDVPRSPVTMEELDQLKQTAGWTSADAATLLRAGELLKGEEEALVDGWRMLIGAQPHLARWFVHPDGSPNEEYKAAVKKRFVQWVRDILTRPFDQAWLDYQEEIGERHTPEKKNRTDSGDTPSVVPLRYLIGFLPPVLSALPDALQARGVEPDEVKAISGAWMRAIALTIALWSRPYVRDGLW